MIPWGGSPHTKPPNSHYSTSEPTIPANNCFVVQPFKEIDGRRHTRARGPLLDSAPGITAPLGIEYIPDPERRSGPRSRTTRDGNRGIRNPPARLPDLHNMKTPRSMGIWPGLVVLGIEAKYYPPNRSGSRNVSDLRSMEF
ncbi:hypothetical protein GX50_02518 [[Emmonsia] crescens]|uniref:Uncharacterized protein n=1 Tax=[Emmonsia] crescens TaxID=73230 RepID=A0A2B7ZN60_9EURO|nr:hypothetical protein GX50_02518 [Emmonsia crescens]